MNSKRIRLPLLLLLIVSMLSAVVVVGVFGKDGEDSGGQVSHLSCFSGQLHNVWAVWLPIIFYETITLALVARQFYSHCLLKHERSTIQSPLMHLVIKKTLIYLLLWVPTPSVLTLLIINAAFFGGLDVVSTGAFTPIVMVMLSTVGNRMLFSLRQEVTGDWSITGGNSHISTLQFHVPESMMATSTHQSSGEGVEYGSQT
ncbi:hypothetical protein L218DRAFT_949984 [Marasmius fiardii PR-910]|nr:hypothetical protein L218DRAFT_949984 [Marasmius fiardii PR-910]